MRDLQRLRRRLGLLTAIAVGAAVSISGIIGFVGLVVPNIVARIMGDNLRRTLPWVAATGAAG